MNIDRLDHLVLTVADLDRTVAFYRDILGMDVATFGGNRRALTFGNQKINLHEVGKEFEPKAKEPTAGSGDLCFVTQTPVSAVLDELRDCGVEIEQGPVQRTGALGPILSVYVRDPDGNLIEISNYL